MLQALAVGAGAALPLLVFAIVMVALFDREQERAIEQMIRQHARSAVQVVERYVAADIKALHVLAHATPADAPEGFFMELRRVVTADPHWMSVRLKGVPGLDTLALASRRGGMLSPEIAELTPSAVETAIVRGAWIGGLESIEQPQPLQFVRLVVPVVRKSVPRALLTAFIDPAIYSQALREAGIPEDWTVAVLDRDSVIVGRVRSPETYVGVRATESLQREIGMGTDRLFFATNQEGQRVYTAIFRSPFSGWIVAIGVPAAVIEAPVMRTMLTVAIGGLGAILLAVLMGATLARSFASRSAAERQLAILASERETEQRVTDIAANLPGAIIRRVLHPDGTITYPYVSERMADVMGMPIEEARKAGSLRDWAPYVHPDDRPVWHRAVMKSARTMQPYRFDARAIGRDGVERWVRSIGHPRRRADGAIVWDGVILDVTEAKKAEQRQALLVQELSHRVKNTLAVVIAIARRTMSQTATKEEFAAAFEGRLQALARAHTLLTRTRWGGSSLRDVIEEALAPFRRDLGSTFTLDGPDLSVDPRTAITLTLVLHELATNAAKYGALTTAGGTITLLWTVDPDHRQLDLVWTERGGPPAAAPSRSGFGTTLITRSIAHELGGRATLTFPPEGAECRMTIPLGPDPAT